MTVSAQKVTKNNYFILTGAMGAGKSTIINELRKAGISCMDEPARQILAEQRAIGADGIPERNPKLFTELLLSRSIYQFKQMQDQPGPIIYDRGIADNIAYAQLFELDTKSTRKASQLYRYNPKVFFLTGWAEIYQTDAERKS
jgi:predicted ATPase